MGVLTEKVGDNLQKVRNSAEDAFLSCAGHPQFGVGLCLRYLQQDVAASKANAKGKKPTMSNKQLIAKYQALYKMLQSY